MDPKYHIGKRSAAGLYCWDCRCTLCKSGEAMIHHSGDDFYSACPQCGRKPTPQDHLRTGPAAVELGFARPETVAPTGVCGAASFGWAQKPQTVRERIAKAKPDESIIEDEYGREMTGSEFLTMLAANCPIEFEHIGEWFS